MSKLFERRLTFSDELEEALQQLADEACKAPGHCLGINTNRYVAPEGTSLVLKFAEQMCVIELRGGHAAPQPKNRTKQTKLTDLATIGKGKPLAKSDKREYAKARILDLLRVEPLSATQLAERIPEVSDGFIMKLLPTMRGLKKFRGVANTRTTWLYELKASTPRATKEDTIAGVPLTVATGRGGNKNAVAKNIPELNEGAAHLDRKVESKPVIKSIKLSKVDGFWRTLYEQFGNEPMTREDAGKALKAGHNYAGEILRHMCYLGCADNLPRKHRLDPRRFFLIGTPDTLMTALVTKNGAATSEPPVAVTRKPSIAAALRARKERKKA